MALERAFPSAEGQGADEVLFGHEAGGTIASCRNALAARAQGDWLCFLDADDELAPRYIDAMRQAGARRRLNPPPLLTPAVSYVIKGRHRAATFHRGTERDLAHFNWLVIGTLIHRDVFQQIGGFQDWPHGLEDWALWSQAHKLGCRVIKVRGAIYVAHKDENSKHAHLMRTAHHPYWHQKVGHSIWPEVFDATTEDEDENRILVGGMRKR